MRVREARGVQPVAAAMLTVSVANAGLVNEIFIAGRGSVLDECLHSLDVGGKPVKSRLTRRASARRSASGAVANPCEPDSTNESIALARPRSRP